MSSTASAFTQRATRVVTATRGWRLITVFLTLSCGARIATEDAGYHSDAAPQDASIGIEPLLLDLRRQPRVRRHRGRSRTLIVTTGSKAHGFVIDAGRLYWSDATGILLRRFRRVERRRETRAISSSLPCRLEECEHLPSATQCRRTRLRGAKRSEAPQAGVEPASCPQRSPLGKRASLPAAFDDGAGASATLASPHQTRHSASSLDGTFAKQVWTRRSKVPGLSVFRCLSIRLLRRFDRRSMCRRTDA